MKNRTPLPDRRLAIQCFHCSADGAGPGAGNSGTGGRIGRGHAGTAGTTGTSGGSRRHDEAPTGGGAGGRARRHDGSGGRGPAGEGAGGQRKCALMREAEAAAPDRRLAPPPHRAPAAASPVGRQTEWSRSQHVALHVPDQLRRHEAVPAADRVSRLRCGNRVPPNSTEFISLTNNTAFATDYVRSFPNIPTAGSAGAATAATSPGSPRSTTTW